MEKTKLVQLLKTFDSKELRAFGDFVLSPFYNKNREISDLYFFLKKMAIKGYPEQKLRKSYVSQIILPKEEYDEKRFNHLISQLLKLAEQFIGLNEFEGEGVIPEYFILKGYVKKGLEKNYNQILRRAKQKLDRYPHRDAQYYYQEFLLANVQEQFYSTKNIRTFDESLQGASDALDKYFFSLKLKFLVGMLDRESQLSEKYQHNFMDEVINYISEQNFKEVAPIHIYHTLLLTFIDKEQDQYFDQLKYLLDDIKEKFSQKETKEIFYGAINYCVRKIRTGNREYAEQLLKLYEKGLEKEVLLEDGVLSRFTFKNYVKLGLGLSKFDNVRDFVTNNYKRLPNQFREESLYFSLADLYYHIKDYDKALIHLNQVDFSDIYYVLGAKVMLLKIYYEKSEVEALLSLIQSFRIYLKRNQHLSENIKNTYLNFASLINELFKKGKEQSEKLKQSIQQTTPLTDRSWLLQQLED